MKAEAKADLEGVNIRRMRKKRSNENEIKLREPKDMKRRERCLQDPELYLRTYFDRIFYNPFADHHKRMIQAIYDRAFSGGDKAIAAPRGDGKSQITICMVIYCFHATQLNFPVIIGQTSPKARKLFSQVKSKYENVEKYEKFSGDFPEVCDPVAALRGAPQRAPHLWYWKNGVQTLVNLQWKQDVIVLPTIEPEWGNLSSGNRLVYFGLDGAIRGEGFEEMRPDLAIIDDPESREVAFSPTNRHEDIEDMIDGDVAGLSGPNKRISRVVLTTIQNRKCYSYRVTSRKIKPTFDGDRYGILSTWPEHEELWDEYIALRKKAQSEGDKDGKLATQFYRDNYEAMNLGAVVTNPHRFVSDLDENGNQLEIDALQAFYNRVSDWGLDRVLAELQNEPAEEEEPEGLGLLPGTVAARMSGLAHAEVPAGSRVFFGCDVGKYKLDWVKIAFHGNCVGHVIDYGEWSVIGTDTRSSDEATEIAILRALHELRRYALAQNRPEFGFVDSGDFTNAVYEFVRQTGAPFVASKGHDDGRMNYTGESSEKRRFFDECRADFQLEQRLWLYHVNAHKWKSEVQQRFATNTFDETHTFNDGSLSVWSTKDPKEHLQYAQQICAEERQEVFIEGKGLQKKWVVKSRNNHKLDATALAICAAACMGIKVIPRQQPIRQHQESKPRTPPPANRFRQRPGGWVPRR